MAMLLKGVANQKSLTLNNFQRVCSFFAVLLNQQLPLMVDGSYNNLLAI